MTDEPRTSSPWFIAAGAATRARAQLPWWAERGRTGTAEPMAPPSGGNGSPNGYANGAAGNGGGNGNGFEGGGAAGPPFPGRVRIRAYAVPAGMVAALVLGVLLLSGHYFPTPILTRSLVPVFGLFATISIAGWLAPQHPDEPWLARLLVLGVIAKEIASFLRYRTLVNSYGDVGDASVFDLYGHRYSQFWLHVPGAVGPQLANIRKSNFLRWFTGVVYYLFGQDMIAGFIVFGLIAFVGSYLWYRAAAEAVPFLDRRLFFLVVMFVPSILFWPSSIGKEAVMQLAIGSAALGTAHLFNGKLIRGLLVAAPGAWLMWVVRPHLLALVVLAAAMAFLVGGQRKSQTRTASASLVKPLGLVVLSFLVVFAVGQGAKSLGLPSLTLGSVQAELDATTASTQQGSSAFNPGPNSLSPLRLPQGMVTVLLRPFPWEVSSKLQELASLEGAALVGFMFIRRKSIAASLRNLRTVPFLLYCWVLTILYSVTFQAFANFGLLDRERSLVLPALYVLLCLDVSKIRQSRIWGFDRETAAKRKQVRGAR